MNITITPIKNKTLGAVVAGVDLNHLDGCDWEQIYAAFLEHAALVFPGQFLDDDVQIAFGQRFGEIEQVREGKQSLAISNRNADGTLLEPDDHRFKSLRGNEGWHHDSTYMPVAAKAGLLSAIEVPSTGGETALADTRAGYDALDNATRAAIAQLQAYHSLYASQAKIGYKPATGSGYGYGTQGAPLRPLVKVHPQTGRKALCIGRHTFRIPGMSDADARVLLDDLLDRTCRPGLVYTHTWVPGDLLVWDNRCVMHRACAYDTNEPRVLQGTRIAGDPATESAPTVADELASGYVNTAT
jgi:alpha-ketoglutarate-dependent taurine dioxygenase